MTTSDLERRLTTVLHQHAENAMNRTHTDEQLQTLLVDTERDARRRRRGWIAGGLVAAAAAIVLIAWGPDLGSNQAETVTPAQVDTPTEVATGFLDAYASFDSDRVVSYLAEGSSRDEWLRDIRWNEAVGFRFLLDRCTKESSSPTGTVVRCAYDFYALRSDELGRGPFSDNVFTLTVQDGKIVATDQGLEFMTNGFSDQMWDPFAAWVAEAHPGDAAKMYADWPQQTLQAANDESIELWDRNTREYVETEKQRS